MLLWRRLRAGGLYRSHPPEQRKNQLVDFKGLKAAIAMEQVFKHTSSAQGLLIPFIFLALEEIVLRSRCQNQRLSALRGESNPIRSKPALVGGRQGKEKNDDNTKSESRERRLRMKGLTLHCGGQLKSREEVFAVPVPPPTASYVPLSHESFVTRIEKQVAVEGITI